MSTITKSDPTCAICKKRILHRTKIVEEEDLKTGEFRILCVSCYFKLLKNEI